MMKLELTDIPALDELNMIRMGLSSFNVAKIPELLKLPEDDYLVVLYEDDKIVGGAICEFDWGWLFIDTLWVDESLRGKSYGKLILQAAEAYAAQKGVQHAYLYTTSFQAKPFYEKLGYTLFGEIQNRPQGHRFYFLQKSNLTVEAIDPRIKIIAPQDDKIHEFLEIGLLSHAGQTAPFEAIDLAVFLRDDKNKIWGGIFGSTFWAWYDLRFLWVDDSLRGQGWGKKLLEMAEEECRRRNCIGITCDTSNFQALPFYQSQGFEIIGTLKDRPPKHESYFLQKLLNV